MLPKKNRISRKDFPSHKAQGFPNQLAGQQSRVWTRILDVKNQFFSAVFYRITDKNVTNSRVSVVVSKKTAKTAVARNTLRRRFYDLLAPHIKGLGVLTTIVVYPKIEAQKAPFSVLKSEMEKALRQAKLIN